MNLKYIYNLLKTFFRGLLLITFISGFLYCKKEEIPPLYVSDLRLCEEAYPGVQGEVQLIHYGVYSIYCELIDGQYVCQGDILFYPEQYKSTKGIGINKIGNKWPNYRIPYEVNKNLRDRAEVVEAINHFNEKTNIEFVAHTNEENYIEFKRDKYGCASYFGMIGGKQEIRIADWARFGNIVHEIGHALGLLHEHNKEKRDSYIKINWENIPGTKRHNFQRSGYCLNTEGFDFNSIMMYSPRAFSKDKRLKTIDGYNDYIIVPQRNNLSKTDILLINTLYPRNPSLFIETDNITQIHQ